MIQDLDRTLEQMLRDRTPLRDEYITFDVPDDTFRARLPAGLTANLYLYDIRENHDLREPSWPLERQPDGRIMKQRPQVRIDLFYMVTAWSRAQPQPDVLAEHALLSRILRTLLRYPTLPPEILQGALIGQEPPLPTLVAQPDGMRNPPEFWGALRQPPRPGIHLVVTIAVEPSALTDEPQSLTPVVSLGLGFGQGGGTVYRMGVRPSLPQRYEQGARLRHMTINPAPVARLQQAVFASRRVIRVLQVRSLSSHEWVLIDDGANSEFVRLGEIPGPGEQEVVVTPPLRFAHDPAAALIPIRRATTPDPDVIATSLEYSVNDGVDTLRVADRGRVAQNDVLLISDEEHTEVVQIISVTAGTGAGDIQVRPNLRFAHRANRNLYRRLLEAAPPIRLDAAAAAGLAQGDWIWIQGNAGQEETQADVVRITGPVAANADVLINPALNFLHDAGREIRRATFAAVGALSDPAANGANAIRLDAAAAAVLVQNNWIWIQGNAGQEETQADVVRITGPVAAGADVAIAQALNFPHDAGRSVRRVTFATIGALAAAGGNATRLAQQQPAAQPGSPLILDSNVAAGVLMVGAGPNVEFCRLDVAAIAGAPVAITPPLRNNHPANIPLRSLTEAEVVGRLDVTAPADSSEVVMVGELSAVDEARRRGRPLVSAGEVLQLDIPQQPATVPASFQVTAVTETPGAFRGAPEEFIAIGGWITDNATTPNPVVGAQVTLLKPRLTPPPPLEPWLTATTDGEGRFTFANLLPGTYTLRVTAPGYQDAEKDVQVPALSVDEYCITLSP